jgi:hypothetical protein
MNILVFLALVTMSLLSYYLIDFVSNVTQERITCEKQVAKLQLQNKQLSLKNFKDSNL